MKFLKVIVDLKILFVFSNSKNSLSTFFPSNQTWKQHDMRITVVENQKGSILHLHSFYVFKKLIFLSLVTSVLWEAEAGRWQS